MNFRFLFQFFLLISLIITAQATHYKLFVLTGEGNALGMTAGGEADPTSGSDPADQHIPFFWDNIANPTSSIGTSSAAFTTLQDQQGGHYAGSSSHWGLEMSFSRTLYRAGVRDFAVIKATRGDGGGNSFWLKGGADPHMYNHILSSVTTATNDLTANGHTFEIVGLIYAQGESDSSAEAALAGTRLKTLVDNLRADLPSAGSLKAVISGIAATGTNRDTVRTNQQAIATSTSYIDYISNTDLQSELYNPIHFNKTAKVAIGERAAVAFLDNQTVLRHYGKLVFMGDSITQGGNGDHPSYRYEVFRHLATKSVPIDANAGYKFTGSVTGSYRNDTVTTPDINGQVFENVHEGHFGWRAFWENGRIALPSTRRSLNRGEGTILNWTGQASPQEYDLNSLGNKVAYPNATASSGNTGTTYIPDTLVILIGINDLGDAPHDAVQANADFSLMIDQVRAANPNVRIHLNLVLPADRNLSWEQTKIPELNGYLVTLAATKNAESSTSPVWIVDAATGFNPNTMAYDNLHPNSIGEAYVGDRVAASLGLLQTPLPPAPPQPPHEEKDSSDFSHKFEGNEIFDGTNFINGWSEQNGADTTDSLVTDGTNLRHQHTNGSDSWLEGTNTGWADVVNGDWTWETKIKFNANPSGYFLWIGTGTNRIYIEIHGDHTQNFGGAGTYNVSHNNLDGNFHTFRVINEKAAGKYHLFRDGVRLTPIAGEDYESGNSDSRFHMGDYTGGAFGNLYDVEIDYVRFDQGGLYLPAGADADGDGITDAWEYQSFGDITSGTNTQDLDGDGKTNQQEYEADTDPNNKESYLKIDSIAKSGNNANISIQTSSRRNYSLYRSSDLGILDDWTLVQGPISGNDGTSVFTDSSTTPNMFYRVTVTVP